MALRITRGPTPPEEPDEPEEGKEGEGEPADSGDPGHPVHPHGDPPPYGGIPPFESGSDTSRAAAQSMEEKALSDERRVYTYLAGRNLQGATDDELEVALDLIHQNASARRRTLQLGGFVVKTDQKRKTRHGRWAGVYVTWDTYVQMTKEAQHP
jgi:hypothetical protein